MTKQMELGGSFALAGTTVKRMGYGAMQLAGPGVYGPPKDVDGAIGVLRAAVDAGVNHIDTSDFYGPHVTNQLIKRVLHPYPKDLVIVTKLGAKRGEDKSWNHARTRQDLIDGVHDNLRNLGLDSLDVVNMRVGGFAAPEPGSIAEQITVLAELKEQGLIRHIGVSNVNAEQVAEAQGITESCVRAEFLQRREPHGRRADRRFGSARDFRMFRSFRWVGLRRCSRACWMRRRPGWERLQCSWRWPGCCSGPRIFY